MDEEKDIEIEAEVDGDGAGDPEAVAEGKVKKLKDEIAALKKEKQEYLDGWQRAKADYVNALRRFEEEKKAAAAQGAAAAAESLLPALDALERAEAHHEVPEGFRAIHKQLEAAFAALGLGPIGEVGERFDPAIHEALGQDEAASAAEDDTVTAVLEKGWKAGDVVIRPAKVRVAHFKKTN